MTSSFSLERLRELHEAATKAHGSWADGNASMFAERLDTAGALSAYLHEHVPAILALADRLQELQAAVYHLDRISPETTAMFGPGSDEGRAIKLACDAHASRTREQRGT